MNTARGSLIDTDALVRHCATGRIGAVLDVTDPQPLPPGHPLLGLPSVGLWRRFADTGDRRTYENWKDLRL